MTYEVITGIGNVQSGAYDYLWKPRTIRGAAKYGVVLLHGASATSDWDFQGVGWPSMNKLGAVLANAGIPAVGGFMAGNNFANDATCGTSGTAYINAAIAYMAAQTGCSASKAHLFGVSMGGASSVRFSSLNPAKAASASGLIPCASIYRLYTENTGNNVVNGFPQLIASGWGLTYRAVTDGVTNGTTTLTSATAAFTGADVGRQITRNTANPGGIPVNTKIASVTNATTVVMDKAATASASALNIGIGAPLPMTGSAGADLLGVHAPVLLANNIPNRWYYASDDPFITASDVTALAAAAGGSAYSIGAGGHANASGNLMDTWNSGTDFSDFLTWLEANGA